MAIIDRAWIGEGIKHIENNKLAYQPGYRKRLSQYGKSFIYNWTSGTVNHVFKGIGQDYSHMRGLTIINDKCRPKILADTDIAIIKRYEYIKLKNGKYIKYKTFCNLALGSFAWFYQNKFQFKDDAIIAFIDNLYGQPANQNVAWIIGSIALDKKYFREISPTDAIRLAQAGHFVFAAQTNKKGAGHVSLIIDGECPSRQRGPNYEEAIEILKKAIWPKENELMPVCWNVGAEKRYGIQYLTYAFASGYYGDNDLSEIMFFVHDYKL